MTDKFETAIITVDCCNCGSSFRKEAVEYMTKKEWQTNTWKNKKYECTCCMNDFHEVTWDYETAEDNMCGDGCMIEGTCDNCGATGRGEFSNRNVDFEVGDL